MEIREPIVLYNRSKHTVAEYLSFEKESLQKHEFFEGEIFAMAGASNAHNEIFSNVFIAIGSQLKGKPCKPYGSDLRIHIRKTHCLLIRISPLFAMGLHPPRWMLIRLFGLP
ncbi:MAG: Uma2 family endonuclease [Bacteroidota bacterium]